MRVKIRKLFWKSENSNLRCVVVFNVWVVIILKLYKVSCGGNWMEVLFVM